MRFWPIETLYDWFSRKQKCGEIKGKGAPLTKEQFYEAANSVAHQQIADAVKDDEEISVSAGILQCWSDNAWSSHGRPFYQVWPGISRALQAVDFNKVPNDQLELPQGFSALGLRFAEGQKSLMFGSREVRWILVHRISHYLIITWDVGEESEVAGMGPKMPVHCFKSFTFKEEETDSDERHPNDWNEGRTSNMPLGDDVDSITAVVAGVLLLAQDPDQVLPCESEHTDAQLVSMAAGGRQPKIIPNAWHLGGAVKNEPISQDVARTTIVDAIETVPHYRRPHPAWVACGTGWKERRLVMRRGSIIHRRVVEQVPTGLLEVKDD